MEEGTPLTLEQARQLHRSLMERMLDRAASDPTWKQQLLDDPEAALREANFPETQQIQRMEEQGEARGHISAPADPKFLGRQCYVTWYCPYYTYFWEKD